MAIVLLHRQRCLAIPCNSDESNSDTIDSSSTIDIEELSKRTVRRFSAELSTGMANHFTADDLSGQRIGSSAIEIESSRRWMERDDSDIAHSFLHCLELCRLVGCWARRVALGMKCLFSFRQERSSLPMLD